MAVICFCMSAMYVHMYTLRPQYMECASGELDRLHRLEDQPTSGKYKYRHLIITLRENPVEFRVKEENSAGIKQILEQAASGDSLKVYYRTALQSLFGDGSRYDVYQVEKGKEVLFSIDETRSSNGFAALVSALLGVILYALSVWIKKAREKRTQSSEE